MICLNRNNAVRTHASSSRLPRTIQFRRALPFHAGASAIRFRTALGRFGCAFPDSPLTLPSPREGRGVIADRFGSANYLVTGRGWFPLPSWGEGRVRGESINDRRRHESILNPIAVPLGRGKMV